MKRIILFVSILLVIAIVATPATLFAEEAPPNILAVFLVKLSSLEKNLSTSGAPLTVHVIGAPAVASELQGMSGSPIGSSSLGEVTSSDALPGTAPSILFVGSSSMVGQAAAYCAENKVLSFTSLSDQLKEGMVVGIGVEAGKPKVLLNLEATNNCGVEWNPAIMKIAQPVQ